MLYLDTSVLVAALVPEAQTDNVHDWLLAHPSKEFVMSDWTLTEFASALSLKRRTGELSEAESAQASRAFDEMADEMVEVIPLTRQDFAQAARLIRSATVGLRAGDALHLTVALREVATLCTLDQRLLQAARETGVVIDPVVE